MDANVPVGLEKSKIFLTSLTFLTFLTFFNSDSGSCAPPQLHKFAFMKLIKITAKNQITIPRYFRRRFPSDYLLALETPDGILLRPVSPGTKFKIIANDQSRNGSDYSHEQARKTNYGSGIEFFSPASFNL